MERRLKERLTGAVVLLLLAIIFVPMILDNSAQDDIEITDTNIPPEPDVEFKTAVLPVEPLPPVEPPSMPLATTEADNKAGLSPDNAVPATVTDNPDNTESPVAETALPPVESVQTVGTPVENQNVAAQNPSADNAARGMSAWVIQLGSFSNQANADRQVRDLQTHGFPAYIEKVTAATGIQYKVRVGPELSRPAAENIVKNLKAKMNLDGMIVSFP